MSAEQTILVVASAQDPDTGFVGERLEQRGYSLVQQLREEGLPTAVPAGVSGLLLLGSAWSVATPEDEEALAAECALVRSASSARVPVLGLCYGAQVVAHAYGGRVTREGRPEVGLITVDTTDEELVPPGPWWAFHSDVIDLPPAAALVASNACGVQAFTLPGVLGVQFHPEVRPETLDGWAVRFPHLVAAAGKSRMGMRNEAVHRDRKTRAAAHKLVDGFLLRFMGPE